VEKVEIEVPFLLGLELRLEEELKDKKDVLRPSSGGSSQGYTQSCRLGIRSRAQRDPRDSGVQLLGLLAGISQGWGYSLRGPNS
jgi:hypothetical protein